jgi:hypothetical protein
MLNVTFSNLTYEHAFITQAHSTPVGNGCVTAISSASFSGILEAPPKAKPMGPLPSVAQLKAQRGR